MTFTGISDRVEWPKITVVREVVRIVTVTSKNSEYVLPMIASEAVVLRDR